MTDNCATLNIKAYATFDGAIDNPYIVTVKTIELFNKFKNCWLNHNKQLKPGYYNFKYADEPATGPIVYCAGDDCSFSFLATGNGRQSPTYF